MKLRLASLLLAACGSSSSAVVLGSTQAGPYTFDVKYEGPAPVAGAMTTFVLKATAGGMPTSVVSWVGPPEVEPSTKTRGIFDAADGDYDFDITVPTPLPAASKYYFDVTTSGTVVTGSMDL